MNIDSIQRDKGPYPGYTQFNSSAGKAITAQGSVSGAGTTFTATTVTDAAVWDLSTIAAGMVAKTSGGWFGLIKEVDDGSNKLTVVNWELSGHGDKRAAALPVAGETVQVHRVHKCCRITLWGGTNDAYLARNATPATPNWVKLSATAAEQQSKVVLEPKMGKAIDVTEWYGITASGLADVYWVAE